MLDKPQSERTSFQRVQSRINLKLTGQEQLKLSPAKVPASYVIVMFVYVLHLKLGAEHHMQTFGNHQHL